MIVYFDIVFFLTLLVTHRLGPGYTTDGDTELHGS